MTHNEYPSSDPLGYLLDLDEAIAQHDDSVDSAAQIVNAYGRCQVFGIELAEETARLVQLHIPAVQDRIQTVLGEFVQNARMLGQNWLAEQDPWEADEIVRRIVNLRTDVLGWELIFGNAIQANIDAFDAALRTHQDIIKTSLETNWFQNLREMIRPDLLQRAWWLDSTPLPVADLLSDLPSPEFYVEVRRVQYAKSKLPEPIYSPALAADVASQTAAPRPTTLRWSAPDGSGEATFNIPAQPSTAQMAEIRPLKLWKDGEPVSNIPLRFSNLSGITNAQGQFLVTLADLRSNWDGRLFVGSPEIQWILHIPDAE